MAVGRLGDGHALCLPHHLFRHGRHKPFRPKPGIGWHPGSRWACDLPEWRAHRRCSGVERDRSISIHRRQHLAHRKRLQPDHEALWRRRLFCCSRHRSPEPAPVCRRDRGLSQLDHQLWRASCLYHRHELTHRVFLHDSVCSRRHGTARHSARRDRRLCLCGQLAKRGGGRDYGLLRHHLRVNGARQHVCHGHSTLRACRGQQQQLPARREQ